MIEFLGNWTKNIVYVIIFVTILEILLPNNSMRKYIRVVAGLLIMVVILTPITQLFDQNVKIQDVLSKSYVEMEQMDIKNQKEALKEEQNEMTIKLYKEKIENQMKTQLEENVQGIDVDVKVDIFTKPKKENFSQIKKVEIYVDKMKPHKKENKETFIEPIKRIEIGSTDEKPTKKTQEAEVTISPEQERKIKEIILDFYNVPLENISISKQKNNLGEEVQ